MTKQADASIKVHDLSDAEGSEDQCYTCQLGDPGLDSEASHISWTKDDRPEGPTRLKNPVYVCIHCKEAYEIQNNREYFEQI